MPTKTLLVAVFLLVAALGIVFYVAPPQPSPGPVACTMEAKLCPDGSAVGRTGPNCEFAACPEATTTGETGAPPVAGQGEHCGGFIQNAPQCASGYHCQLVVSRPDTGGTCIVDAPAGGGGILPYNSGIRGTVMLGPTCPVERMPPDPQCADKGYQTAVIVSRASSPSKTFASVRSDADGTFEISLPPGDYIVAAAGGQVLPRCAQASATVGPTGYTQIIISCDTGIR